MATASTARGPAAMLSDELASTWARLRPAYQRPVATRTSRPRQLRELPRLVHDAAVLAGHSEPTVHNTVLVACRAARLITRVEDRTLQRLLAAAPAGFVDDLAGRERDITMDVWRGRVTAAIAEVTVAYLPERDRMHAASAAGPDGSVVHRMLRRRRYGKPDDARRPDALACAVLLFIAAAHDLQRLPLRAVGSGPPPAPRSPTGAGPR